MGYQGLDGADCGSTAQNGAVTWGREFLALVAGAKVNGNKPGGGVEEEVRHIPGPGQMTQCVIPFPDEQITTAQPGDTQDAQAASQEQHLNALFAEVYNELRGIARGMLKTAPPNRTLQPTALVHEAYLRLCQTYHTPGFNRRHFFGAAAESMRRILVEDARRRLTIRRGGNWARIPLDQLQLASEATPEILVSIDEALEKLGVVYPVKAQVVKLMFFGGLTAAEAGEVLGLCDRTVKRHWAFARAWLFKELEEV